jgi:hypothetical protein
MSSYTVRGAQRTFQAKVTQSFYNCRSAAVKTSIVIASTPVVFNQGYAEISYINQNEAKLHFNFESVFARSNTAIVGSNPTEAWMFVCVLCAFFLFLHSLK